jgi:hypothetical protein
MVSSFLVKVMGREKADTSPESGRAERDGYCVRREKRD